LQCVFFSQSLQAAITEKRRKLAYVRALSDPVRVEKMALLKQRWSNVEQYNQFATEWNGTILEQPFTLCEKFFCL
jgi:hypothetical protein